MGERHLGLILLRMAMALGSAVALGQSEPGLTPPPPPPPPPAVAPKAPAALTPLRCFDPLAAPAFWNPLPAPPPEGVPAKPFQAQLPPGFLDPQDPLTRQLVREYGATLVSRGDVARPVTMIFPNEAAVTAWQSGVSVKEVVVGGVKVTLQTAAMAALQQALAEAAKTKLAITPTGADAARRTYAGTVINWKSRVDAGLVHWQAAKKLAPADAAAIKALTPAGQIPRILALEEQGLCFAKSLDKTILRSVAAPGSSQHVFMLALDVRQHADPRVRALLARHGWFQTVVTDEPHFTFLGADAAGLPALGLKPVKARGRDYWVPDIN